MLGIRVVGGLAVLALASPAAVQHDGESTYVPGRVEHAQPYSLHGSAAQPGPPRGGGPSSAAPETPVHVPAHRRMHRIQSDNQTRRPGAVNYTGPSFKDGDATTAHRIPAPQPVNVAGDHPTARTGAHNHGPIPVRAAASNEDDYRKARQRSEAVGGGPPTCVPPSRR